MTNDRVREAVLRYGSPLYLYNLDQFRKQLFCLRECLFPNSGLFFSMKANPLSEFCRMAHQAGCGVEIASDGELEIALESGIVPEDIVFSGPGKTEHELEQAIQAGIYMIHVESIQELRKIQMLAERKNTIVPVALRINPCGIRSMGKVQMSGTASQFGMEESALNEALMEEIMAMKNIDLCGIHVYMGTSILSAKEICRNTEYVIRLGIELSERYSFELRYLNAGGGFGIPYFPGEEELDRKALKDGMRQLAEDYRKPLERTKVFFESGRYLLAECGLFLTRILYRKESRGNTYLVCDGGANFHASSAFLGRFIRQNFPMYVLGKEGQEKVFYVTGPSCTPTDLLGQRVLLPEDTKEGDILVIEKSGAYGLTYSPYGFLSHKLPLEVGYMEEGGYSVLGKGDTHDIISKGNIR